MSDSASTEHTPPTAEELRSWCDLAESIDERGATIVVETRIIRALLVEWAAHAAMNTPPTAANAREAIACEIEALCGVDEETATEVTNAILPLVGWIAASEGTGPPAIVDRIAAALCAQNERAEAREENERMWWALSTDEVSELCANAVAGALPESPSAAPTTDEPVYCMASSPDGHHCALPLGHTEQKHFGGSPLLPEVEWIWWAAVAPKGAHPDAADEFDMSELHDWQGKGAHDA